LKKVSVLILIAIFFVPLVQARIISYSIKNKDVLFVLDKGFMDIKVCMEDIIEIKYTLLDSFSNRNSLVINNDWSSPVHFSVQSNQGNILIKTGRLIITINKDNNSISYKDVFGNLITREDEKENKIIKPDVVAGIETYSSTTQFISPKTEALYGLGCHPEDSLSINYKGRNQDLLIKYMTGAIPVLLSTKGYGLLWDNYSASKFYGAEENNTKFKYVSESAKEVDYYFFYGPSFDQIINLYRVATGKAPLFPKWAFGLFQSQDRYKTSKEILEAMKGYRNNHIPVDVLVQDWYWWSPLPIGSHIMNPERYPNPKALIDSLHNGNIHAMISIWPVFGQGTANYNALKANGFLTSITWDNFVTHTFDTYYDAHNPLARALYWGQARDSVVKRYGWDAWWVDQCEPDNGELLDERRKAVFSVGKGIDYFNSYSLEHSKGIYQGWRRDIPNKRAFFLMRQSFAGAQRNAAVLWSSDITTTFSSLKNQIPQGINACASGIPYWTSDIGGYISRKDPDGIPNWSLPMNRELFTRWFQFGTFCPIMRIHGKGERALFSENWDSKTKDILLHYDQLRYRLIPYVYSLAAKTTFQNYTIMRALAFDFPRDTRVYNIPDEYMFGPSFLVCPITQKTESGDQNTQPVKEVYLPKGTWYNFWNGHKVLGGQRVKASAPMDIIPVFIRAGSIIPMGPAVEYATQESMEPLEIRIYPGANGSFQYYEDENDSYNYEKGNYATFAFNWNDKTQKLTITQRKGSFPGMKTKIPMKINLVKPNQDQESAKNSHPEKIILYSGKSISIHP